MLRFEGNTPQYTGFALVAIESVYPNPEGNELTPDESDLTILGADAEIHKSQPRDGFRPPTGVETERDYFGKQGYYKILPLNIIRLETSSSISNGSNFTVHFTLDDLVLTLPKNDVAAFRYATGLPIPNNEAIDADLPERLPHLIDREGGWSFVRDSDLGLARYRINGAYSGFNVEDLVDINDTVTIWLYHEPQEFYTKDELPTTLGDMVIGNNEITGIIGSGDRQSQFSTDSRSFDETFLHSIGLVNPIVIEAAEVGGAEQISPVNQDNIMDVVDAMANSFSSGTPMAVGTTDESLISRAGRIEMYVGETFPEMDDISKKYITDILANQVSARRETDDGDYESIKIAPRMRMRRLVENLPYEDGKYLIDGPFSAEVLEDANELDMDPEQIATALNAVSSGVNQKSKTYANDYLRRREAATTIQYFASGRTVLVNKAHGETPYLVMKGSVSSVSSTVGAVDGTHVVSISGSGYEKVLDTNKLYYEPIMNPSTVNKTWTDYNTIYSNMSPPRAIQHMVSRWAAKQVLFAARNEFNEFMLNHAMIYSRPFAEPNEDEELTEQELALQTDDTGYPGTGGKILVRGVFAYASYIDSEDYNDPSLLRAWVPLNYLDIFRVREMATVLEKSYRDPALEASVNVPQVISDQASLMENIRKISGAAQFYETFVDETGKLRYRLTFEAMERTPDTGYTPIIQDFDFMANGSSFGINDSRLVTLVDVIPLAAANSAQSWNWNLGFRGRSVPPAGQIPIEGMNAVPAESISPELFRYGIRPLMVQDLYQQEENGANRKAALYRLFYGNPLKQAAIRIRGNSSYRVGETALIVLQKNRKRSRALIDIPKMIDWLDYLMGDQELLEMYIGVESRFLEAGKNSYIYTRHNEFLPIDDGKGKYYPEFLANPHLFVAEGLKSTLEFIHSSLDGSVNVITPEYFPTTYWYHARDKTGSFGNWDFGKIEDDHIIELHRAMLRGAVLGDSAALNQAQQLLDNADRDRNLQGVINAVRFQNFRATSYYIESVSHNMVYGEELATSLQLNYGQDTLVLLEPKAMRPIGFLSIEKKMKIGWDDPIQNVMWEEANSTRSALQKMYLNQFKEDRLFKQASFLHNAQYYKNSSNYMYEMSHVFDEWSTREADITTEERTESVYRISQHPEITREGKVKEYSQATGEEVVFDHVSRTKTVTIRDRETGEVVSETQSAMTNDEMDAVLDKLDYESFKADYAQLSDIRMRDSIMKHLNGYETETEHRGKMPSRSGAISYLQEYFVGWSDAQ